MKKIICVVSVAWICLGMAEQAPAKTLDEEELPWDRFHFTVAFFLTNWNSNGRIDVGTGLGTQVNFEELLGLDSTTTQYRLGGMYRLFRRHRFSLNYIDLTRDALKYVSIEIPELDFLGDGLVGTRFQLRVFRVGYTCSFFQDYRFDFFAGIGFHVMDIELELRAADSPNDPDSLEEVLFEGATLPLPVFRLGGEMAVTRKVFLKLAVDFFYINLSGFEGLLVDSNIALEYNLFKYFGLGLGFNMLRVEITGDADTDFLGGSWRGHVEFDYAGLMLYGKFYF